MKDADAAPKIPGPGEVLAEKYSISRVLGQGGMGCVVAARHLLLNQDVAIKFLPPHGAQDPQFVKRFLREAQTAASIRSEHVVRVLDIGVLGDGVPYMVMEYLDGEDLGARVDAGGPLSVGDAAEFTLQACEALAEAHAAGLAHRDIKPSNLFVTKRSDGSPLIKLLDFGIAKAQSVDRRLAHGHRGDDGLAELYVARAGPRFEDRRRADGYLAPGRHAPRALDRRPPFSGTTFSALCAAIISDPPSPLREERSDAPAELEAAILQCLEKDPARRFPDVAALAAAVAPFAGSLGHISADRTRRVLSPGSVEAKTMSVERSSVSVVPSLNENAAPFAQTEISSTTSAGDARGRPADERRPSRGLWALVAAALVAILGLVGFFALRQTTPKGAKELAAEGADAPTVAATPTGSASPPREAPPPSTSASRPFTKPASPRPGATSVPASNPTKGPGHADPFADQH